MHDVHKKDIFEIIVLINLRLLVASVIS